MAKPATDSDDLSMEDILSSIRKIVSSDEEEETNEDIFASDDGDDLFGDAGGADADDDGPIDAGDAAEDLADGLPKPRKETNSEGATQPLMSRENSMLGSAAFSLLHRQVEMGDVDGTLSDVVKSLLRPMLQNWLDDNLPNLVERLVQQEIARIAGNGLNANNAQDD